jgi:hypothetical protein
MKRDVPITDAPLVQVDRYLAAALRAAIDRTDLPPWPRDWPDTPEHGDAVFARIAFHGLALALLHDPARLAGWPARLVTAVQEEARAQSFWERGHREVLARLLAILAKNGTTAIATKGTALAYSAYPEPALRRRGDSDLLVGKVARKPLRRALAARGFTPTGDARPLQESWSATCALGFTHVFDLHWRINASPVIAEALERARIGTRTVPLPAIGQGARALAPADNLVVVALNRASHLTFGYHSGADLLFEGDRLIWALDIDLVARGLGDAGWEALVAAATASGSAPLVHSALAFATDRLGTAIPPAIMAALAEAPGDERLLRCVGALGGFDRLRLELTACPTWRDKLAMTAYTLVPDKEVLRQRFPDALHWPTPALYARRLLSGATRLVLRRG